MMPTIVSSTLNRQDAPAAGVPTHFRGRLLFAARAIWLAFLVLSVVQVIFATPVMFAIYQTPCTSDCSGSLLTQASFDQLASLGISRTVWALSAVGLELFFAGAWGTVACLIFARRGDEPLAWFVSLVLLTFGHAFPGFVSVLWQFDNNPFWMAMAAPVILVALCGIVSFFFLFPDGRFVPGWTRWFCVIWMLWTIYTLVSTKLQGNDIYFYTYYLSLALGVVSQIYRYRSVADPVQRQQTKWVVFGVSIAISMFLGLNLIEPFVSSMWRGLLWPTFLGQTAIYFSMALIPFSIDMAIFRSRLWDIDLIIGRTLVYGALTASVVAIYVLLVGYLGTLFQTTGNVFISLLVTGLVAVLFQPLRDRLQRAVNRLIYGERDDPYAVISRLGQRLETTFATVGGLRVIVETVAQALKLPYVAIALVSSPEGQPLDATPEPGEGAQLLSIVAASGTPVEHLLTLPLLYQGQTLGQLILAPRAPSEPLTAADRRLLADLARQAGGVAHAVQLTTELQHSRERLVNAREEERRRLRRDLHDGLGPQLAALTLKLDAARNLLDRDPAQARTLLDDLKGETQAAIGDIRRLVYDLRPPALDQLGLLGALRQHIAQYEYDHLRVTLDVPATLPPLSAAVEVAAYRIALEALTNVVKHASAHTCVVSLGVGNGLYLDIRDDGRGLPAERRSGVGLHSMRERAAELGGNCIIDSPPDGGTSVVAWLPLA